MIPLRDNIPSRTVPFVNYAMMAMCSLVFIMQLREGGVGNGLVERYGMIPQRVLHPDRPIEVTVRQAVQTRRGLEVREAGRLLAGPAVPPWLTLLTCIFLHGGWMHFIGNMWFLYIFGDNVEDRFGHMGYGLFYMGSGAAASAAHLATNLSSSIPTIGASGAIAGVMGAYLLLYPKARVLTILPIFFFIQLIVIPAPIFLGIWFLIQFFQGAFSITSSQSSGVAWWAHIGGFVVGALVAWKLNLWRKLRGPVEHTLPHTRYAGSYRMRRGKNPWG